jgi:hypothetical protein
MKALHRLLRRESVPGDEPAELVKRREMDLAPYSGRSRPSYQVVRDNPQDTMPEATVD